MINDKKSAKDLGDQVVGHSLDGIVSHIASVGDICSAEDLLNATKLSENVILFFSLIRDGVKSERFVVEEIDGRSFIRLFNNAN